MNEIVYEDGMPYKDGRIILYETAPLTSEFQIYEAGTSYSGKKSVYKLKGLFHLAETRNANNRIYPRKILEREVKNLLPLVKSRSIYGALDHPSDPTMKLGENNCCIITDLIIRGNKVLGELEIIDTQKGKDLKAILEAGGRVGISARGLGSLSVNEDGLKVVQEDYQLITWDIVPNPSTPNAWLSENIFRDGNNLTENYKKSVLSKDNHSEMSARELRSKIKTLFGG